MPKRSDFRTLKNLIDQAYLIASPDPVPKGGMKSLRENLDAARALVRVLLMRPDMESMASELGKRGGRETAKRGAEYYAGISALRKTKSGGRPKIHQDVFEQRRGSVFRSFACGVLNCQASARTKDGRRWTGASHSLQRAICPECFAGRYDPFG